MLGPLGGGVIRYDFHEDGEEYSEREEINDDITEEQHNYIALKQKLRCPG